VDGKRLSISRHNLYSRLGAKAAPGKRVVREHPTMRHRIARPWWIRRFIDPNEIREVCGRKPKLPPTERVCGIDGPMIQSRGGTHA
jgi:hypothetical protein